MTSSVTGHFSQSLEHSTLPQQDWLSANIISVFKKDNQNCSRKLATDLIYLATPIPCNNGTYIAIIFHESF